MSLHIVIGWGQRMTPQNLSVIFLNKIIFYHNDKRSKVHLLVLFSTTCNKKCHKKIKLQNISSFHSQL